MHAVKLPDPAARILEQQQQLLLSHGRGDEAETRMEPGGIIVDGMGQQRYAADATSARSLRSGGVHLKTAVLGAYRCSTKACKASNVKT